jgi:competence protein ComEC
VYDTGPSFPSGFNTGDAVVAPYLREIGVRRVDLLVASHGDQDHAGGLRGLIAEIPVERVLSGEPDALDDWLDPGMRARVEPCRRGQGWVWDGVELSMLHPDRSGYEGNDSSCVLRVRTGTASVLLPGDIAARVERALADAPGQTIASSVLVAAHHGSATSTSAAFLDAVRPRLVLGSSGYANRFGFPAEAVRARVAARGIDWHDTADLGGIELRLMPSGEILGPVGHRRTADRLWRHQPGK